MNHKNTIVAGFLAASAMFFGVSHAQGMGGGMGGPGGPGGCDGAGPSRIGMMRDGAAGAFDPAKRIERLKGELKITPEQEPLWQAFAEQTKGSMAAGMAGMRGTMANEKLTAPERMAQMQALMKSRMAAMESLNDSFGRLYSALSPEQKAAADAHFSHIGRHGHKQRPGRGVPKGATPDASKG